MKNLAIIGNPLLWYSASRKATHTMTLLVLHLRSDQSRAIRQRRYGIVLCSYVFRKIQLIPHGASAITGSTVSVRATPHPFSTYVVLSPGSCSR